MTYAQWACGEGMCHAGHANKFKPSILFRSHIYEDSLNCFCLTKETVEEQNILSIVFDYRHMCDPHFFWLKMQGFWTTLRINALATIVLDHMIVHHHTFHEHIWTLQWIVKERTQKIEMCLFDRYITEKHDFVVVVMFKHN